MRVQSSRAYSLAEERFVEFEAEAANDPIVRFPKCEVVVVDCADSL